MERAYREDELLDASIIDSEGYVYGKVEKININENEIILLAREEKPDAKTLVDINSLKETLLGEIKTPFGPRLGKTTPGDILATRIRKELGLGVEEQLNDDHYVKYAERMGASIPHVKATVTRKEQKGTVNLNEVKTIKITVLGKDKGTRVIKIVLLHEPKEAKFRKIPIQERVAYRSTEVIKDKLVLDADGTALGYVDSVVLFQNMPGLRVYISKIGGQVGLSLLAKYLDEGGQSEAAAVVREHLMSSELRRGTVEIEELEEFMRQRALTFRVPDKVVTTRGSREFVADIPWSEIHKIGDIVLLKSTLTDLRSKGFV